MTPEEPLSPRTKRELVLSALPELNPTAVLLFCPLGSLAYANPAAHELRSALGRERFEELLPPDHDTLIRGPIDAETARAVRVGPLTLGWLYRRDPRSGVTNIYASQSIASGTEQHLLRALQRGLSDGELDAFFQPIVHAMSGRVVGFEALARWRRVDGSWIAPETFIPVAERSRAAPCMAPRSFAERCLPSSIDDDGRTARGRIDIREQLHRRFEDRAMRLGGSS